jgi:hypothetical protein
MSDSTRACCESRLMLTPQLIRLVVPLNERHSCWLLFGVPADIWRCGLCRTISGRNLNLVWIACPTIDECVQRASSSLTQTPRLGHHPITNLSTQTQLPSLRLYSHRHCSRLDLTSRCVTSSSTSGLDTQHSPLHIMSARNSSQQQRTSTGQTPTTPPKLYQFKLVLLGVFSLSQQTNSL